MTERLRPQRVAVKFFADPDPGATLDLNPFIGLFHSFIQAKSLPGLLIDVADYAHVPNGPGILLVGHDVDYAIDRTGGRTGLLTVRKRCGAESLDASLRGAIAMALVAVQAISESAKAPLGFATQCLQIQIFDRLATPNSDEGFERARGAVEGVLAEVFGTGHEVGRSHSDDPRKPLSFRVSAPGASEAKVLAERLAGRAAAAGHSAERSPGQSSWDIEVEELARLRGEGADFVLVDVREPREVEICSLGGMPIPLGHLAERLGELDRQAHIVVYCRSGVRGGEAVEVMRAAGFDNAWNVSGGILAWAERIDPSIVKY